jgi:hypothetical protein
MRNPINVPPRMDAVIDYDEAAGFLKNSPSLEPRPNFTNICALQKHIVQAIAQLLCPQSAIHRWSGLAMDPTSYLLLEGAAFTIPLDLVYGDFSGWGCHGPNHHENDAGYV